jgi:uncharacterized protein
MMSVVPLVDRMRVSDDVEDRPADRRSQRGVFLKWLRKMHGWIGLWGALLGLLFGVTGILQNHRAVMKIPAAQTQEASSQLALPTPPPASVKEMASWLQGELHIARPATRVRSEPEKTVPWGDKALKQPEHWSAMFASPEAGIQADYWVGNRFIAIKRSENNLFATLNNLHKGVGVSIGWILLVDTLAGSIILLSLTGLLLWVLLNKRHAVGVAIFLASLAAAIGLAVQSI